LKQEGKKTESIRSKRRLIMKNDLNGYKNVMLKMIAGSFRTVRKRSHDITLE
jgi:hypothetical protein